MYRAIVLSLTLAALILSSAPRSAAAEPAAVPGDAVAVTESRVAAPAPRAVYGPITSKDPAVRAQVKRLYLERNRIHDETRTRLAELADALGAETDADFRWEMHQEIARLKRDLEIRSVELGLQIAQLNEDPQRVAEFELALDQLTNPEKYRPAPVDPSVQQERIRAMRTETDGGAR